MRKKNQIIKELRADIKQLEEDLQTVEPDSDREACYSEKQIEQMRKNFEGLTQLSTSVGKDGKIIMTKQTAKKVHTEIKRLTDRIASVLYSSKRTLHGPSYQQQYRKLYKLSAVRNALEDANEDIALIRTSLAELAEAAK